MTITLAKSGSPVYILYLLPSTAKELETGNKPLMAQVLTAYNLPYTTVNDLAKAMRLSKGNANPSSRGCVAWNIRTQKAFYDFLEFCKDVKDNQSLPCININL